MAMTGMRAVRGAASAEWLVVAPAVLAVGFGVLQWALLMHGRASVEYAAFEGARAGATSHAEPDAIVAGIAVGLVGIRGEEITSVPVSASRALAIARLQEEIARGVARWSQRRPDADDFADWSVPAVDDEGRPLPGVSEIPNDNLRHRGSDIGPRSGRSLLEANLLEVELVYAWPMRVPLIGGLAVRWMEWFDGCDGAVAPAAGYSPWGRADWRIEGGAWRCPFYRAGGAPRWPLRVVARARMHSAARHAGSAVGNVPGAGPLASASGPAAEEAAAPREDGFDSGAQEEPRVAAGAHGDAGAGSAGEPVQPASEAPIGDEAQADDVADRADISQPGECFAQAAAQPRPVEADEAVDLAGFPLAVDALDASPAGWPSGQPEVDVGHQEAALAAAVEALAAKAVAVQAR